MRKLSTLLLIVTFTIALAGCGNRTMIDTKWNFTEATIKDGDTYKTVLVKSWKDYEGDAVQIIAQDGQVYLTSYVNVVLKGK